MNKFENVVEELFLVGGRISECLKKNGLELKDGVTVNDFSAAMKRGLNKKRGKLEIEIYNASEAIRKVCREVKS